MEMNAGSICYHSYEEDHNVGYSHFVGYEVRIWERYTAEISHKTNSLPPVSRFNLRRIFIWLWKYL